MIYFNETVKENLEKTIKKNHKQLIIVSFVFAVFTILCLISINWITETFSLILEIIISTFYGCYLLLFFQILNHNKNVLELHNSMLKNETTINCEIKEILGTQTINRLLFVKVLINTNDGEQIVFLYNEIKPFFSIGDSLVLVLCKNMIKGWLNEENVT